MAIFRLNVEDDNLHNAELVIAKKTDIELEKHLESWLENSPRDACTSAKPRYD
jgi:hypothetical protein